MAVYSLLLFPNPFTFTFYIILCSDLNCVIVIVYVPGCCWCLCVLHSLRCGAPFSANVHLQSSPRSNNHKFVMHSNVVRIVVVVILLAAISSTRIVVVACIATELGPLQLLFLLLSLSLSPSLHLFFCFNRCSFRCIAYSAAQTRQETMIVVLDTITASVGNTEDCVCQNIQRGKTNRVTSDAKKVPFYVSVGC